MYEKQKRSPLKFDTFYSKCTNFSNQFAFGLQRIEVKCFRICHPYLTLFQKKIMIYFQHCRGWSLRKTEEDPHKILIRSSEDSEKILRRFREDSKKIPKRFQEDSEKIPRRFREDSKKISRRFRENSKKIFWSSHTQCVV